MGPGARAGCSRHDAWYDAWHGRISDAAGPHRLHAAALARHAAAAAAAAAAARRQRRHPPVAHAAAGQPARCHPGVVRRSHALQPHAADAADANAATEPRHAAPASRSQCTAGFRRQLRSKDSARAWARSDHLHVCAIVAHAALFCLRLFVSLPSSRRP